MKLFLKNILLFFRVGIIYLAALLALYFYFNPFKVLYNTHNFINENEKGIVSINQDYVSTTTFINNSKTQNYNSFIFGNSRSIFYEISNWKKHLDKNASCYHFDASSESLWAINKKFEFLDKRKDTLKNILLVLDYTTLMRDLPKAGHLHITSPALVDNSNFIEFHKTFFFAFLNPKFLYAYLDFKISDSIKPYMKKNALLDDRPRNYDVATNELRFAYFEDLINKKKYYTPEKLALFYDRDTTIQQISPVSILENQKKMLKNIQKITKKHGSNIKIIISPLYNQLKLNEKDLTYLKNLFGNENVYDFSGINNFTKDYKNYYETSHYRPHVAKALMEIVY